jgi:hypothetical protein
VIGFLLRLVFAGAFVVLYCRRRLRGFSLTVKQKDVRVLGAETSADPLVQTVIAGMLKDSGNGCSQRARLHHPMRNLIEYPKNRSRRKGDKEDRGDRGDAGCSTSGLPAPLARRVYPRPVGVAGTTGRRRRFSRRSGLRVRPGDRNSGPTGSTGRTGSTGATGRKRDRSVWPDRKYRRDRRGWFNRFTGACVRCHRVTGATGPLAQQVPQANVLSASTTTAFNGLIKGDRASVGLAVADTDYLTPATAGRRIMNVSGDT